MIRMDHDHRREWLRTGLSKWNPLLLVLLGLTASNEIIETIHGRKVEQKKFKKLGTITTTII